MAICLEVPLARCQNSLVLKGIMMSTPWALVSPLLLMAIGLHEQNEAKFAKSVNYGCRNLPRSSVTLGHNARTPFASVNTMEHVFSRKNKKCPWNFGVHEWNGAKGFAKAFISFFPHRVFKLPVHILEDVLPDANRLRSYSQYKDEDLQGIEGILKVLY